MPRARHYTTKPLSQQLPRICEQRGISLRQLARGVGVDHSVLRRMIAGDRPIQAELVAALSTYLDLPPDYFPEVRLARLTELLARRPRLRDEIYFDRVRAERRR